MSNCKFYSDGKCLLGWHDEPTPDQCDTCMAAGNNKSRGLGDSIAALINQTPLRRYKKKDCGCKKRQDKLNRVFKYGNKDKSEN